jgi:CheY-like chemotaxis protein
MSVPIHPDPEVAGGALPLADRILLIEDAENDVVLLRRVLAKTGLAARLEVVTDGEMAIRWLTEQLADAENGRAVLPRAILLDLKLPGVSGLEVLRWIRAQSQLDRTIVGICSSSGIDAHVTEASGLGADAYLLKYPTPGQLTSLLAAPDRQSVAAEPLGSLSHPVGRR